MSSSSSSSTLSSLHHVIQRRTANIQWCEDVIASHAYHSSIAEFHNTWTNISFCIVACLGLYRCYSIQKIKHQNNNSNNNKSNDNTTTTGRDSSSSVISLSLSSLMPFIISEIIMFIGIGFGSMLFHAHQSRLAQWSDEFPMTLLLVSQTHCLQELHPWTRTTASTTTTTSTTHTHNKNNKQKKHQQQQVLPLLPFFYWINHGFVFLYWFIYMCTNKHKVFEFGFTIQIIMLTCLGCDTSRRLIIQQQEQSSSSLSTTKAKPKTVLMTTKSAWSLGIILISKVLWDIERTRYETNQCSLSGTLWLHPLWHIGAATSHFFSMSNNFDLVLLYNENSTNTTKKTIAAAAASDTKKEE